MKIKTFILKLLEYITFDLILVIILILVLKKITPNQADWVKQIMANTQHAKSNVPFFYYMQIVFAKYIIT